MPALYTTRQDETVDLACWKHYRRTAEVTELVLRANPGLAAMGPVLPFGTVITMPDVDTRASSRRLVSLYD